MAKLLAYLLSLACLIYALPVSAKPCFITNCPPGGKRSGSPSPSSSVIIASNNQQCTVCGPNDSGVCLGQNLCCGPSFGCFFRTAETIRCLMNTAELCNEITWDGQPRLATCSLKPGSIDGLCVADRLCCSSGQCKPDTNCRMMSEVSDRRERIIPFELGAHLNR